ncbi:MAG TPA: 50S ribosomal protein L4 [bacterium]|nr:50S ribosomal protein L4 [bacterium]
MATAQAFDAQGQGRGSVELPADVFGIKPHTAVVHEVLVAHMANQRAGTHSTKTRGEVSGSTRKIWRQKGTGRARHGSRKAPLFPGGGITFGPHPREHRQHTPQKIRQLAVRSVLSAKAAAGAIVIVDPPTLEVPKTKAIVALLAQLPVKGKTLLVTATPDAMLVRSAANLPHVVVRPAAGVTVYDLLAADAVVFTTPAVAAVVEVFGP